MVKKTKRFKYEAKKSAKEFVVRDEPKPEPAIDNQSMNKKRIIMIAAGAAGILVLVVVAILFSQTSLTLEPASESNTLDVPRPDDAILVDLSSPQIIFKLYAKASEKLVNNTYSRIIVQPRDDAESIYSYLRNTDNSTIAIYPSFTRTAYSPGGLAYNYLAACENCIASKIIYDIDDGAYAEGHTAYQVLKILDYDFITDVEIDKNPQILLNYDKVILLHNEYATQNMFDAITSHPNVVYLYPGALSIKTNADYVAEQLLLVRGNGYPDASVGNGFDWEYDNSNFTQNVECQNWEFIRIENGHMLNCYPESIIHASPLLLLSLKELDDPYWAKPLQNQVPNTVDANNLKLMLLNDAFVKLTTPSENLSSVPLNETLDENMSIP